MGGGALQISVGISPRQTLASWADLASELEAEGVGRLWLIDSPLVAKDVYAGLLLAAQHTTRMLLGTGVTNPLTRHPTVTAGAIAAVAEVSRGRAALGLGAGDSAVRGVDPGPAPVARVEAAVRFLRALLRGDEGTWQGRAYRLPHAPGPVPVWLSASQRRMCALAGRVADGVILRGPATEASVRRQVGWVAEGLRAAGRLRETIEVRLLVTTSAREEPARALDDVRSWAGAEAHAIAGWASLPAGLEPFEEEIRRARGEPSDELTAALTVAGTPDECVRRVTGLLGTGIDGCIFPLLAGGRREWLRSLRDGVVSRV